MSRVENEYDGYNSATIKGAIVKDEKGDKVFGDKGMVWWMQDSSLNQTCCFCTKSMNQGEMHIWSEDGSEEEPRVCIPCVKKIQGLDIPETIGDDSEDAPEVKDLVNVVGGEE